MLRSFASPLGGFLELLDFTVEIPPFRAPLFAGILELQAFHFLQFLFVLRLDFRDELLRSGFRPRHCIEVYWFGFAPEFRTAHLRAFETGFFRGVIEHIGY